jgi:hypothetical protein
MMHSFDAASHEAFARLLAQPDPRDLPRRGHVRLCDGDPNRRATRYPAILMGWLQRRHLEVDVEEPLAPATRMVKRHGRLAHSRLRVLRPTGTD